MYATYMSHGSRESGEQTDLLVWFFAPFLEQPPRSVLEA
jgi:hypothetical protein